MTAGQAPRHQGRLELTWTDKEKTLLSIGDGKYDYTFVDPSDYRVSEVEPPHVLRTVGPKIEFLGIDWKEILRWLQRSIPRNLRMRVFRK